MNNMWWWVAGLIAAGFVVGTIASLLSRRYLGSEARRPALREVAGPVGTLLFWLFVAAGLIAAVASASPDTIENIPSDLLAWLPHLGVAGIILIAGLAFATIAATAVSRIARRATGHHQPAVATTIRTAIVIGAAVLALRQLGIDTTILDILAAALAFGVAGALAGIAIVGGRPVAQSVALGRALTDHLEVGAQVTIGTHTGDVTAITATHVVMTLEDGNDIVLPFRRVDELDVIVHR